MTVVQEATEHLLAKPLLLALGDKSEACRELAINMLISLLQVCNAHPHAAAIHFMSSNLHNLSILDQNTAALQVAPDAVIAVLPYAVPVLEERLQAQEVNGN